MMLTPRVCVSQREREKKKRERERENERERERRMYPQAQEQLNPINAPTNQSAHEPISAFTNNIPSTGNRFVWGGYTVMLNSQQQQPP